MSDDGGGYKPENNDVWTGSGSGDLQPLFAGGGAGAAFVRGNWSDGEFSPSEDDDELPAAPRGPGLSPEDRELLELAARALGARFEEVEHEGCGNLHFEDGRVVNAWNPLAFSGDAFELAFALRMKVKFYPQGAAVILITGLHPTEIEEYGDSGIVSARRVISRGAALLGKQRS